MSTTSSGAKEGKEETGRDPLEGKVIETISVVTEPTMDLEKGYIYQTEEKPNRVYYGDEALVQKLQRDGNKNAFNAVDVSKPALLEEQRRVKKASQFDMRRVSALELVPSESSPGQEKPQGGGSVATRSTEGKEPETVVVVASPPPAAPMTPLPRQISLMSAGGNSAMSSVTEDKVPTGTLSKTISQRAGAPMVSQISSLLRQRSSSGVEPSVAEGEGEPAVPASPGDESTEGADSQVVLVPPAPVIKHKGLKFNDQIKYEIGEELFRQRYASIPHGDVIICCSFIANHQDISERERNMAKMWLCAWDDGSRDVRLLRRKGINMASM